MSKDDIVVFGQWTGDGYGERFAIVRDIDPTTIDLRYGLNGDVFTEQGVKSVEDATEGEDYWRAATPVDFTDQRPVSGQVVWVSHAREEENSNIYRGIVLSSPEAFGSLETPLRTIFGGRTRTLLPEAQAAPCDSFWAVEEPTPVYCDDD